MPPISSWDQLELPSEGPLGMDERLGLGLTQICDVLVAFLSSVSTRLAAAHWVIEDSGLS